MNEIQSTSLHFDQPALSRISQNGKPPTVSELTELWVKWLKCVKRQVGQRGLVAHACANHEPTSTLSRYTHTHRSTPIACCLFGSVTSHPLPHGLGEHECESSLETCKNRSFYAPQTSRRQLVPYFSTISILNILTNVFTTNPF